MHESPAGKSKVNLTAWGKSFIYIKIKRGPEIDPYGTAQEFFPKPESLLSILTKNIHSER